MPLSVRLRGNSGMNQAVDHSQGTVWIIIFPSFAAFTVPFMETLQLKETLIFPGKACTFLRARLVQNVGIFSPFTLTAANYRTHSCSIYLTGNC